MADDSTATSRAGASSRTRPAAGRLWEHQLDAAHRPSDGQDGEQIGGVQPLGVGTIGRACKLPFGANQARGHTTARDAGCVRQGDPDRPGEVGSLVPKISPSVRWVRLHRTPARRHC